jgi:hypothetical protein
MYDIVAVEVTLRDGQRRYFLTWGRIQDTVDPKPLADIVLRQAHRFALDGEPESARVLWDLRPVADMPQFFESFFDMCHQGVPRGRGYERWRKRIARDQERGAALWYLGYDRVEQPDEPDATIG